MSNSEAMMRLPNWIKSWKPYDWSNKKQSYITTEKDKIRKLVRNRFEKWVAKDSDRKDLGLVFGWYKYESSPGKYKPFAFITYKAGGGMGVVNPQTPPQPQ
jgi:hypothetical protein